METLPSELVSDIFSYLDSDLSTLRLLAPRYNELCEGKQIFRVLSRPFHFREIELVFEDDQIDFAVKIRSTEDETREWYTFSYSRENESYSIKHNKVRYYDDMFESFVTFTATNHEIDENVRLTYILRGTVSVDPRMHRKILADRVKRFEMNVSENDIDNHVREQFEHLKVDKVWMEFVEMLGVS